jgi:hypothetical protein
MARERVGRSGSGMELVYRPRGRNGTPIKAAEEVRGKAQTTSKGAGGANRRKVSEVTLHVLHGLELASAWKDADWGRDVQELLRTSVAWGNLHARLWSYFTFQAFPCATLVR